MINLRFSSIKANNLLGRSLRWPLALLPKTTVLPIMQGAGKGMKWIVGSGVHGMWLGSYEADKQQLLSAFSLTGTTIFDIGANVGFFSLLFSRMVGKDGKVMAFEPLPRNIAFIQQHIEINHVANITIHDVALSDISGTIKFTASGHNSQARLSEDGELQVRVMTLDQFKYLPDRVSLLKIDVEGAESKVLEGGPGFFQIHRPLVLLATHSREQMMACQEILARYDYAVEPISQDLYGLDCDEWLARPKECST